MVRNGVGLGLIMALALALAACSSDSDKAAYVNPNIYPAKYKQEIVATLRALFTKNETTRVSGAVISQPMLAAVGKQQRYTLCVRYVAHGTSPGMIGNATRRAYFYGGQLNQLVPVTDDECANVAYQPFTELNNICLGKGCEDHGNKGGWSLF